MPAHWWPVTKTTADAWSRWVSDNPAAALAAVAAVTPGTIAYGMPASRNACSSSPARPKINGSPPLSRTVFFPALPKATNSALISAWVAPRQPARLPAKWSSTDERQCCNNSRLTKSSHTTASASRKRFNPRTVMRSIAPGPAPTSQTKPREERGKSIISYLV